MIDFVGQKSPTLRVRLMALDVVILVLQCTLLAVFLERRAGKGSPSETSQYGREAVQRQDHDAEERGILTSQIETTEDIEMQDLNAEGQGARNSLSGTAPISQAGIDPSRDLHPLDVYAAGDFIIADFDIIGTVRSQWGQATDRGNSSASTSQTSAVAALTARRIGVRLRARALDMRR